MKHIFAIALLVLASSGLHAAWLASDVSSSCAIREHLPPLEPSDPYLVVGFGLANEPEVAALPGAKVGELLFYVLHFGHRAEGVALAEVVTYAGHQFRVVAKDKDGTGFAVGMPESGTLLGQLKNGHTPRLSYTLSDAHHGTVSVKAEGFSPALQSFRACSPAT